jgi:geranylgeranyl diphosphate synthase, type I
VAGSLRFVDLVQNRLDDLLADRGSALTRISPDLDDLTTVARDLLGGGKRFRALFCYWGWQAVAGRERESDLLPDADDSLDLAPITAAASALEIFHAAALVHDDIMDNSDLRRGRPSTHRRLEAVHRERGLRGDAERYGMSGALLLGDLLLGWSDELLDDGLRDVPLEHARATRDEFAVMRTEVTAGQYLDILEESSWHLHGDDEQLRRAQRVVLYKSAKYSVEAPLVIGASIAGADADQIGALRGFGVPLGIAFQLRDDLLGVFGDPDVTGKPSGDDLREGKRTVLIALARESLSGSARNLLDELLGDPELDDEQIRMLQSTIRASGAVDQLEGVIRREVERATSALDAAPLTRSARAELLRLADAVTRREA